MDERADIKSMTLEELRQAIEAAGERPFRAGQVFSWLHAKRARTFDEMSSLSKELREKLAREHTIVTLKEAGRLTSEDGTCKFLFELADGQVVESVRMRYRHGTSVCISSQAGCRMGCRFCASTLGGKVRDLTASEMLEQVYEIERIDEKPVSHVVVMGTGEPMDNYDNFVRFVRLISAKEGKNLSVRSLTVSTCGIPEAITRLAQEELPLTLALSLHAPNDTIRRQLMPVAARYPLSRVLAACDGYYEKTSRRITYEYALFRGVNDSEECARELAGLLRGKNCHVNLIPANPVKERKFSRPTAETIQIFKNILEKNRTPVTIRREMGSDIDAACGQLRRSYLKGRVGREED